MEGEVALRLTVKRNFAFERKIDDFEKRRIILLLTPSF